MKLRLRINFGLGGCIFGAIFGIIAVGRYFILYPDPDRGIVYTIIGFLVIGFSVLYDRVMKNLDIIENLEEYIVDKEEKEKCLEEK